MKKNEIIKFLKENPGWVLQYQRGIRGDGWWWLRDNRIGHKHNTINVDGRSALGARSKLQLEGVRHVYGETNYIYPQDEP